jgi:NAD(P)H-dependent FMN reductase
VPCQLPVPPGLLQTHRANYPGILKNLLDITPVEALQNKPVGIVAMGGSPHH